jgi:hypothetical protein
VEFITVGGYATMLHGSALMTQDVDVACRMTRENLLRLEAALKNLHPVHRQTPQKIPLDFTQQSPEGWKNIYLRTDWGQLDCLGEIKGIGDFDAVLAHSEEMDLGDGLLIQILTLDALIEAKKAVGRPRDIHAVHELEAIRELRRPRSPSSSLNLPSRG